MPTGPAKSAAESAYAAFTQHSEIQSSFPSFEPPKVPDWLTAVFRFLSKHPTALGWIFWSILAATALFVGVALVRQYWPALARLFPARKPAVANPEQEWRPTVAQARQLLSDSDALAAQGEYSEAIHLLLLRSVEDIERKWPRMVRPTLTSREIGALEAIPDAARSAFVRIARVVEHAIFAGRDVSAADFRICRQEYENFALAPV